MNPSQDPWNDLTKSNIVVSDVYREAYYRLKNRTHTLEERVNFLESSTRKFKQRAKMFVENLEETFLNGNELIIDRGNYHHKYLKMIDTFHEIQVKSNVVEKTLLNAIDMKKNIDQQKLIIQQKLLDNQNMQEKITEKNKENDRLRETIKTQDTDIKNSPQYLQLINKMQKLHEAYNKNKIKLEEIIMEKQSSDDTVEKLEHQVKLNIKKERAWINSRVQFEKKIQELNKMQINNVKINKNKDNKINLLSREVKRKQHIINSSNQKLEEEMKRFVNFEEEKTTLQRKLKVSEQKNGKYQRENINLKKKLEQYKSLQFVVDNVQDLKESISYKDAEIIEQKESIIMLQQKVSELRNKYRQKQLEQEKIIGELKKEKEHAMQANAAAVVASTKLARTRSLQNVEMQSFGNKNIENLNMTPSSSIISDGIYVEALDWKKELRN